MQHGTCQVTHLGFANWPAPLFALYDFYRAHWVNKTDIDSMIA